MSTVQEQVDQWLSGNCPICGQKIPDKNRWACEKCYSAHDHGDDTFAVTMQVAIVLTRKLGLSTVSSERVRAISSSAVSSPKSTKNVQESASGDALGVLRKVTPRLAGVQVQTLSYKDQRTWRESVEDLMRVVRREPGTGMGTGTGTGTGISLALPVPEKLNQLAGSAKK